MTIRVVFPEGDGIKQGRGTKVFTESGHEIEDVTGMTVRIMPDELIEAQMTVYVSNLENFEGIEGAYRVENFPAKKVCSGIDRIMKRIRRGNHEHN
jgi:hypothetical protein